MLKLAKGLEFDLVVLLDRKSFGAGTEGAVDRYVAMTRATQQLVILTTHYWRAVDTFTPAMSMANNGGMNTDTELVLLALRVSHQSSVSRRL
ncbi:MULTISPECIES: hypothetical protein [unclassified Cryobacterium]|uniref:hypothetical protein n=1 Tax=Cryobacterium sp. Y62 TaxID=2048284 RepID=UPI000CE40486|nr:MULTISPECIES: hypothetical protein [unclassified Cryobacterium]